MSKHTRHGKDEIRKTLENIAANINKKAGKTICGFLDNEETLENVRLKYIATPSWDLNEAILPGGQAGFPLGRCSIVSGMPDSGKTSLVLETIAKGQREDPDFFAVWLESENSLEEDYIIDTFHIDPERFFFLKVDTEIGAEDTLDMLYTILNTGDVTLCCINSLKCLIPNQERDAALSTATVATQARMNARMMRKFNAMVDNNQTAFIIITHLSTDINSYGGPMVMAGGKAIAYWAALIIELRKHSVKKGDIIEPEQGVKIGVTIKKNHCCQGVFPYRKLEYYAEFGKGIEQIMSALNAACKKGMCSAKGAWVYWTDESGKLKEKYNGKKAFHDAMESNPKLFKEFTNQLRGLGGGVETVTGEEAEKLEKENRKINEEGRKVVDAKQGNAGVDLDALRMDDDTAKDKKAS